MIFRKRIFITTALVCHLLILPRLVTAQLLCPPPSVAALRGEMADVCAIEQEKEGTIYKLHHRGRIAYRSYLIWADEATYNSDTGEVVAEGHVLLEGGLNDEYVQASHAVYNVETEHGHFYHVIGTIGVKQHGGRYVLTTSDPFAFTGKVVDKVGPERYVVHHGTITTCEVPGERNSDFGGAAPGDERARKWMGRPKWQFNTPHSVINVEGNAHIYFSTFHIYGIPILFFPYATHPVKRQARHSGLLTPLFGTSNVKGTIFGDSFYWAINRSMDATLGAESFSKRGWAQRGEFRATPSRNSFAYVTYFGVLDRGDPKTKQKQGGEEIRAGGTDQFAGFRAVGNIDYLSSFIFRIVWSQIFTAVYSEVVSQGFLSKNTRGYSYNLWLQRYENFLGFQSGQQITIEHLPSLEFSTVDREFGESGLFWNLDTALDGLHRSQPAFGSDAAFSTGPLVGRFDVNPSASWPLQYRGWSLRPELAIDDTLYTERQSLSTTTSTTGAAISVTDAIHQFINRKAAQASVELRPPALERIYDHPVFGSKLKHVIEPRIVYRKVTGIDNFDRILRFDYRDVLSDSHEVEYGFTQRLYAKTVASSANNCTLLGLSSPNTGVTASAGLVNPLPVQGEIGAEPQVPPAPANNAAGASAPSSNCATSSQPRELLSWELAQKYFLDPTFGGALVPGKQNVFATSADFDAIAFLTDPRHLSPLISRVHVQPGLGIDVFWNADYDFTFHRINYDSVSVGYHIGQFGFGGGNTYLQIPGIVNAKIPDVFNQANGSITYGSPTKRGFSGASTMGFDIHSGFLQYLAIQSTYNWNCCGITVDFRRFVLGPIRNENQYRFTFNLADIGSFGNLTRRYRMY
ncbi:MAG TPA: LPS assembly protein LptD [Terriglobales bacterium]